MSLGAMTDERFAQLLGESEHEAGCVYGGFSCGYWLVADQCERDHWERHFVLGDGFCPCGTYYPGASEEVVFFNQTENQPESDS